MLPGKEIDEVERLGFVLFPASFSISISAWLFGGNSDPARWDSGLDSNPEC